VPAIALELLESVFKTKDTSDKGCEK
jgi:hypothetical protein